MPDYGWRPSDQILTKKPLRLRWGSIVRSIVPNTEHSWVTADKARGILRCSHEDLAALAGSGVTIKDNHFDEFDIWNIGLFSNSRRSRPELEMVSFGRLVSTRNSWTAPVRYWISVEATCPLGAKCESSVWIPPEIVDVHWSHAAASRVSARWVGAAHLRGDSASVLDAGILEVWNGMLDKYRFHYTHRALSQSTTATMRRGVGDCAGISRLFAQLLNEQGVQAKVSAGFLAGGLSARVHHWVEATDRDGGRKTLDISMALLSPMFFSPKYSAFCLGSKLNQVMTVPAVESTMISHPCGSRTYERYPIIRLRRIQ